MSTDYDEQNGAQAFESLKSELEAIPLHEVRKLTVNLQDTALKVAKAATFLAPFRERFTKLPSDAFDMKHFDSLKPLASATWHVRAERIKAKSASSVALLPSALVESATDKRGVMLRVTGYHLVDPASINEIDDIRSGQGYVDLAIDLKRLADLYETHHEILSKDQHFYRPEDVSEARVFAKAIYNELATDRSERAWKNHERRIWTLLKESYEETKLAAEWLLRREDLPADLLPALHGRKPRRAASPQATPETPASEPKQDS